MQSHKVHDRLKSGRSFGHDFNVHQVVGLVDKLIDRRAQVESGLYVRGAETDPYCIQLVKHVVMAGFEIHERAIVSEACSTKQIADE